MRRLVDASRVRIPVPVRSRPRWSRRIPTRIAHGIGHDHAWVFMDSIGNKAVSLKLAESAPNSTYRRHFPGPRSGNVLPVRGCRGGSAPRLPTARLSPGTPRRSRSRQGSSTTTPISGNPTCPVANAHRCVLADAEPGRSVASGISVRVWYPTRRGSSGLLASLRRPAGPGHDGGRSSRPVPCTRGKPLHWRRGTMRRRRRACRLPLVHVSCARSPADICSSRTCVSSSGESPGAISVTAVRCTSSERTGLFASWSPTIGAPLPRQTRTSASAPGSRHASE